MIMQGEFMPSDVYGRNQRHVADFFAVEFKADECFAPFAVAHFQSAWYHSLMASSLIRLKMGCCHSLSSSGARSLPQLCPCAAVGLKMSNLWHAACAEDAHKKRWKWDRQGRLLFLRNFPNSIFVGFRVGLILGFFFSTSVYFPCLVERMIKYPVNNLVQLRLSDYTVGG